MNRRDAVEILREALQLSESDRARVAGELLTSLGPIERRTQQKTPKAANRGPQHNSIICRILKVGSGGWI